MQENQPNYEGDQKRHLLGAALTYAEVLELLPGFVLGALDAEEMLAVESYLDQQQALLDRVTALEATTVQLGYAAPPVALPAHIKTQLLQRAQADLATNQRARGVPPVAFPPRKMIVPIQQPQSTQSHAAKPSRNWFGGFARGLMGFGVAAALLLLAFMTTQLRGTVGRLSVELSMARSDLTQIQTVNQSLQEELREKQLQLAVFSNPTNKIALASDLQPNATATFYIHNDIGMLVANNLQPLPDSQTYQLWLIHADGTTQGVGLIAVKSQEPGILTITIPTEGREFAKVGVTVEPAGGSPAPTGPLALIS